MTCAKRSNLNKNNYTYIEPSQEELSKIENSLSESLINEHMRDYNISYDVAKRDLACFIHFHENYKPNK